MQRFASAPTVRLRGFLTAIVSMQACTSAPDRSAFHIEREQLHAPRNGMQGELEWTGRIQIGPGIVEPVLIEVTSKGNGFLSICDQSFRVYDSHDDGIVLDPPFMHITFVDLNGDRFRDLVLLGARRSTENSDTASQVHVFRYDPKTRRFVPLVSETGEK